jgi:hypothetical protein
MYVLLSRLAGQSQLRMQELSSFHAPRYEPPDLLSFDLQGHFSSFQGQTSMSVRQRTILNIFLVRLCTYCKV